jgi:hypothetical protein
MFLPANTVIKCEPFHLLNTKPMLALVQEISFDFDSNFTNGVKVINLEDKKELYVDDIFYKIEVVKFPDEYDKPKEKYLILQHVLEKYYLFCTDLIYQNNQCLRSTMKIIEEIAATMNYREAYRQYKRKYLL